MSKTTKLFMQICSGCLGGAMLLIAATTAYAQWKWVDENGRTHISDSAPPASVPQKNILKSPRDNRQKVTIQEKKPAAEESVPASEEQTKKDKKLEEQLKRVEAQKAREEAERKEQEEYERKEACNSAKKSIERYQSGMRLRDIDDKGEYYYLDDAEIAKRKAKAEKDAAKYCK